MFKYVKKMLHVAFKRKETQNVNIVSIACALISSTISGLIAMILKHESHILHECYGGNIDEMNFIWKDWIMANAEVSLIYTISIDF